MEQPGSLALDVWNVFAPTLATVILALVMLLAAEAWKHLRHREQRQWVKTLVRSAEQMLAGYTGEQKRDWVVAQAKALFPRLRLNDSLLRMLLEEQVQELRAQRPPHSGGEITTGVLRVGLPLEDADEEQPG